MLMLGIVFGIVIVTLVFGAVHDRSWGAFGFRCAFVGVFTAVIYTVLKLCGVSMK